MLSRVDFPQPEGPISATIECGAISRSTPATARTSSLPLRNVLPMPWSSIIRKALRSKQHALIAAIDVYVRSAHEAGARRGHKQHGIGDVARVAPAAERYVASPPAFLLLQAATEEQFAIEIELGSKRAVDAARAYGVDQ